MNDCQACLTQPAETVVAAVDSAPPFELCWACSNRLRNLALRPLEWYRLAAIHGPFAYLLHDDFYDQDGRADQNRIPVKYASLFPAPRLRDVAHDVKPLFDYSLTRWHLDPEVIAALKSHPADILLDRMTEAILQRPIPWVESTCYEIAAEAIGTPAADWIRSRWELGSKPATMFSFLKAAAASLAPFQSPRALDWIESRVEPPVSERWGILAGSSGLSWETAARWLSKGRPLSLVALDALAEILAPPKAGHTHQTARVIGRLADAPPVSEMLRRLRDYESLDPVPRVSRVVKRIAAACRADGEPDFYVPSADSIDTRAH